MNTRFNYRAAGVVLLLALATFGVLAGQVVTQGALTLLDARVANWFHAHAREPLTTLMLFVTNWHDTIGALVMTALFGLWLLARRARYWLLATVLAVPGGMVLNVLLKYSFQRLRPQFDDPLVSLATYSFPSGHTVSATLFYGVLAAFLCGHVLGWVRRVAIAVAACLMVALVGLSRIYLGAHYLSDVLAAVAEGVAWLTICIAVSATLQHRRAQSSTPDIEGARPNA